ncbi:uncharacterized protein LOC108138144 [Drosophila elegans]|uniref:uncharacterized protein LOC108138144 n=1 Tax=Drosophila elegans TaxID=30023 RepID=UPI0007E692FB|nr:uncharacterized protein LOC108138144 [Drosophila elegans]XP_017115711.1 uncharacterized protein LOC108138144 [Drosophila elegans]
MFPDDFDVEPFNPFNVGPPNSGARSEFKIPTCVTYPPPVFVAQREYSQEALGSASKKSLARDSKPKLGKSELGEVAISKAINEDMAVAKRQASAIHENGRIGAGGVSKVKLVEDAQSKEALEKASLCTLMPVRSSRQASGDGRAKSNPSSSDSSVASKTSSAVKPSQASISSKASNISQTSSASTKLTPKSILKSPRPLELEKTKSKVSQKTSEAISFEDRSLKQQKCDSGSQGSLVAKASKSVSQDFQKDEATPSELGSKSTKAASSVAITKPNVNNSSVLPESKDGPSYIQSETALSYRQSLNQQAAELAGRLNAGNENFRRYNSVARNHSIAVPQKLSQGDRMTFWFSDAVLS